MSDIKKHQSDDLIYVFGQIPVHILMILVFGIIFFQGDTGTWLSSSNPFNWLIIGICSILIIFDIFNIIRAFNGMAKQNKSFWAYINDNLYLDKANYNFMSIDNMRTFGMGMALFGFLILPDVNFYNNSSFGYIFLILVWIGLIFALASLLISFKVHYSKG